jgi:hypothetical protein
MVSSGGSSSIGFPFSERASERYRAAGWSGNAVAP